MDSGQCQCKDGMRGRCCSSAISSLISSIILYHPLSSFILLYRPLSSSIALYHPLSSSIALYYPCFPLSSFIILYRPLSPLIFHWYWSHQTEVMCICANLAGSARRWHPTTMSPFSTSSNTRLRYSVFINTTTFSVHIYCYQHHILSNHFFPILHVIWKCLLL